MLVARSEQIESRAVVPVMNSDAIAYVGDLEARLLEVEQVKIETTHLLHAGMYSRTVFIPKGVVITGALVKIETVLTISGSVLVWIGEERPLEFSGYNVVPAGAFRKQVFLARKDTWLTMAFASEAGSIGEAEAEFTDEVAKLITRQSGEMAEILCQG